MGNHQVSIHITRSLDDLKSSDIFCPRKLFLGKNSSPEKSLQKNRSIFVSKIRPATGVKARIVCWPAPFVRSVIFCFFSFVQKCGTALFKSKCGLTEYRLRHCLCLGAVVSRICGEIASDLSILQNRWEISFRLDAMES